MNVHVVKPKCSLYAAGMERSERVAGCWAVRGREEEEEEVFITSGNWRGKHLGYEQIRFP